jgi:hypothetical protein
MKTKRIYKGSYEVTNNEMNFTIQFDEMAETSHKWNYYIVEDEFEKWIGSSRTKKGCLLWIKRISL